MTSQKKNQHYVPKFYLRNFSIKNNRKQIGLFSPSNKLFVPFAPLKNQASKDFFYGEDGKVEENLSQLENVMAPVIHHIANTFSIPKMHSLDHETLLCFMTLSELRNPVIKDLINDWQNQTYQHLLSHKEWQKEFFDNFKIEMNNAVSFALSFLLDAMEICLDLRFKLVINNSGIPFITSDNPVIKYNQFLEWRKRPYLSTGYGSKGLQVFIPLSPKTLLVFYDEATYFIGGKKQRNIIVESTQDVNQLNLLQILNCSENLFFNNEIPLDYLLGLEQESKKYQKPRELSVNEFKSIESDNSSLMVTRATELRTGLELSFSSISNHGATFNFDNRVVHLRKHAQETYESKRENR